MELKKRWWSTMRRGGFLWGAVACVVAGGCGRQPKDAQRILSEGWVGPTPASIARAQAEPVSSGYKTLGRIDPVPKALAVDEERLVEDRGV